MDYEQGFRDRTNKHIALVNKYANKLGLKYPNHDKDKLDTLYKGYINLFKSQSELLTEEEEKLVDAFTYIHVVTNEHHPEYWTDDVLIGFTRKNPIPNGPIDVSKMPFQYIAEMCCDWCAVSEEMGNTPFEWFDKINQKRWKFSENQQEQIIKLLEALWEEKS